MEKAFASLAGGLSGTFGNMNSDQATSMQGGATAFSVLSSITAGRVARRQGDVAKSMNFYAADFARGEGEIAYRQAELDARQETIVGRARAAQLEEQLLHTLSGQRVAFAAAGGDPFAGTAARIGEQTARRGEQDLALERSNTEIARLQALIRGSTARRSANMDALTLEAEGRNAAAKGANQERLSWMAAGEKYFDYQASVARRK